MQSGDAQMLKGIQEPWVKVTVAGEQRLVRNRVLLSPAGCRRRNYSGSLTHEASRLVTKVDQFTLVSGSGTPATTRPTSSVLKSGVRTDFGRVESQHTPIKRPQSTLGTLRKSYPHSHSPSVIKLHKGPTFIAGDSFDEGEATDRLSGFNGETRRISELIAKRAGCRYWCESPELSRGGVVQRERRQRKNAVSLVKDMQITIGEALEPALDPIPTSRSTDSVARPAADPPSLQTPAAGARSLSNLASDSLTTGADIAANGPGAGAGAGETKVLAFKPPAGQAPALSRASSARAAAPPPDSTPPPPASLAAEGLPVATPLAAAVVGSQRLLAGLRKARKALGRAAHRAISAPATGEPGPARSMAEDHFFVSTLVQSIELESEASGPRQPNAEAWLAGLDTLLDKRARLAALQQCEQEEERRAASATLDIARLEMEAASLARVPEAGRWRTATLKARLDIQRSEKARWVAARHWQALSPRAFESRKPQAPISGRL